jgi:hypothetical protein
MNTTAATRYSSTLFLSFVGKVTLFCFNFICMIPRILYLKRKKKITATRRHVGSISSASELDLLACNFVAEKISVPWLQSHIVHQLIAIRHRYSNYLIQIALRIVAVKPDEDERDHRFRPWHETSCVRNTPL